VDPVPDPLLLRKSGSNGNRTRTSGCVARNSEQWTTEAVIVRTLEIRKMSFAPSYFKEFHVWLKDPGETPRKRICKDLKNRRGTCHALQTAAFEKCLQLYTWFDTRLLGAESAPNYIKVFWELWRPKRLGKLPLDASGTCT
jgi:hypothetical protein